MTRFAIEDKRMTVEEAMEKTGTSSPRAALDAVKAALHKPYVYMPHTGAKQKAKIAAREAARAV